MGKGRSRKAQFPCGDCARETEGSSCLGCEVCNKWFHTKCQRISDTDFERWRRVGDEGGFLCQTCRCDGFGDTFDYLRGLSRLQQAAGKGASALKTALEVECLLFEGSIHYSPSIATPQTMCPNETVDETAEYIRENYSHEDGVALRSTPDGDCLFNATSTHIVGNETLSVELRYRTALMMHREESVSKSHKNKANILWISPDYEEAVKDCCKIGSTSSLWTIMSLAKVVDRQVKVVYPHVNGTKDLYYTTCNATFNESAGGTPIRILWTSLTKPTAAMQNRKKEWRPNHFVPIVAKKTMTTDHNEPILSPIQERSVITGDTTDDVDTMGTSVEQTTPERSSVGSFDRDHMSSTPQNDTVPVISPWQTTKRKRRSSEILICDVSVNMNNRFSCLSDSSRSDLIESDDSSDSVEQTNTPKMKRRRKSPSFSPSKISESSLNGSNAKKEELNESAETVKNVHPLPGGKALQAPDVLNVIISDTECVSKVPAGVKNNVYVILDNRENLTLIKDKKAPKYWDDCGAWDYKKSRTIKTKFLLGSRDEDGGHSLNHVIVKENQVYVEGREKGVKKLKMLDPQPSVDELVTFHRYYSVLKKNSNYKRRVTWVEGLPDTIPGLRNVAIIEYTGEYVDTLAPHGNAKVSVENYERTDPDVMKKIKQNVKHQNPSDVYQQMTDPDLNTSADHPRDLRQCQYAKASLNKKTSHAKTSNVADELLDVIRMVSENHPYVAEMIHSRGNPLPSVICYTKEQLSDLKSFLSTPDGVIGVDRTFSLGKCFVTTTVFKSHKVLRKGTGEPPILIGPLLLHWDGKQETYYRFFAHLRGVIDNELSNIEIIMGSDDEKALTNAIDQAFPGVKRKLCSKHIKDNIIRQMTDKIPKSTKTRSEIVGKLFGENGVAKADDSAMFDERNNAFKQELIQNKHDDFLEYYEKHVQEKISEHVVNQTDQLWTNNNTESINHRLKVLLQWKPRKTNELIEKLYDLVKMQTVDMRRALYGTGNFVLNHRFQKFKITKIAWSSKSENEKSALLNKFLASGLNAVQTSLTSRDGKYSVNKVPRLATKPHQRTRCRPNRTPKK